MGGWLTNLRNWTQLISASNVQIRHNFITGSVCGESLYVVVLCPRWTICWTGHMFGFVRPFVLCPLSDNLEWRLCPKNRVKDRWTDECMDSVGEGTNHL